jgi:hypothetical protein
MYLLLLQNQNNHYDSSIKTLVPDNQVVLYVYSAFKIDSGYSDGILPVPIHISKTISISIR